MLIKRISQNTAGRDFVIGDLHGCLPLLQRLMDCVNFDPAQDLRLKLVSVAVWEFLESSVMVVRLVLSS